ncbi:DEAD/DEAH box helicase [Cyclobacterium xiamenense]|uniref:DEAD/DEAH box helicase n=1 Tax=Cyclobacterium xiamenense TaxID=1297121 RepID=UPI0012B775C2|nr:DEAD/DEAH box helicase [Cyclobacterium xiamenense]
MPVKILLSRNFDHTHERQLFDEFCNKLYSNFHQSPDLYLCIGNLHVEGRELDALLIKKDAISVIEFKNYGGALTFHENGDWPITVIQDGNANTLSVRGGANENPYQQVRRNKFALLNTLNLFGNFQDTNLGHISGIVLFSKNIEFDLYSITDRIASWFHITDLAHSIQKVNQITSTGISLSNHEIRGFQQLFNLGFDSEVPVPEEFQTPNYPEEEEITEDQELENQVNEEVVTPEYLAMERSIEDIVQDSGYRIVHRDILPERPAGTLSTDNLNLSGGTRNYLNQAVGGQIFLHQYRALELLRENDGQPNNVCLATSTSSGKSLVFYAQALEIIEKNPSAKILAIYPLKALGYQQEEKWKQAFSLSGKALKVGRIDGTVSTNERRKIIEDSNVVVVTPDVIHSWFLVNLDKNFIRSFFRNLDLLVIDEVHVYRGVFGSNAAFLYRRIHLACQKLKLQTSNPIQVLCASATISNPEQFLHQLTGLEFTIIDHDHETSPKHPIEVFLLDPLDDSEPFSRIADFINRISEDQNNRSITFVDNRKAVEQIATITDRLDNRISPYRSGYESEDRKKIQDKLSDGTLRGVISTSALEMGIDIGHLNVGILFGVPSSQTSFMQRIGRIGRHQAGFVLIINDKSIRSERVFQNPQNIFNIPPADTALYLDNEFIQYIHALCLVGLNGAPEAQAINIDQLEDSEVKFPDGFLNLCEKVKNSIEPQHLKNLNPNNNEIPQQTFPLRDIEKQFKIELLEGRDILGLGEMTKSQQMREAYPGAVYYHMKRPYRVTSIEQYKICLRNEAHYSTRPILQIMPYPNLGDGLIQGKRFTNTSVIECNLDVYENIFGYYERRGGADEISVSYPNNYFSRRTYSRRIVTTGVLIGRGPLSQISSAEKVEAIANIFFNVFLTNIPFEPQDLNFCIGSFTALNNGDIFDTGERYLCIYDKTYGSLRLTSRLMFQEVLLASINSALDWLDTAEYVYTKDGEQVFIDQEIIDFFINLRTEVLAPETEIQRNNQNERNAMNQQVVPILSLNQKIKIINDDQDYIIDWVYPQIVNGVSTILYDLKIENSDETLEGIPQSSLQVTENHTLTQYDLVRSRIL